MTTWTIFGLGVIAGILWCGIAIITAAWFHRARSHARIKRMYGDEIGV
jgi:hypothetical protein